MNSAMLWFDNDPKIDLEFKIKKATDYYRQKYGSTPDLCLINPSMIDGKLSREDRITVRTYRAVLPGCFWIGLADKN